ncbi:riboflavin biosynthesis protein RibA [Mycobacterium antarcticum]|uniref:3,4-dihydroxy-2-butanone-4-phosphate synthase n=1 Tax=Mycolicibacterium sp. TUM20983 TaxID=3023369 RepID=UPI0023A1F76A|nr:3,4-dihydroxy-2-butanone-4-phosphate synthase [Mycolicibacterium sp. TUM20983]GLP74662.1 riboflavin biosynthesis protein RibA [Mycolicibacterium sp. TUM20983]
MRTTDVRVRRAVAAVAAGRPVVVTAGTDGAGQGYLVFAADAATPRLLAFTVRHTSGLVRIALPVSECERLNLPAMCVRPAAGSDAAAQRVTVDWRGTGTGISATDRARTIAALSAPQSDASDFHRPGHVLPVMAELGGVLAHPGPAEAAFDLARLAGRGKAGALCDIVSRDHPTEMAGRAEAAEFADEHGLAHVSTADLAAYRRRTEPQVTRVAETILPTRSGDSLIVGFRGVSDDREHLAIVVGAVGVDQPLQLHVHVECLTGDVFGSTACRCGGDLDCALASMAAHGGGVVIYLRPPGPARGCGLFEGEAPAADLVAETVEWILRDLGLYTIKLSEDAPALGLVMFGDIRDTKWHNGYRGLPAMAAEGA